MKKWIHALVVTMVLACNEGLEQTHEVLVIDSLSSISAHTVKDTIIKAGVPVKSDSTVIDNTRNNNLSLPLPALAIQTGKTTPDELIRFAETLVGVPYVYASTDPKTGFDCSGFITYVFTHFNIQVPRSSIDFTNVGKTVTPEEAKRGDFILFTGTQIADTHIGHMGLVAKNDAEGLQFIHATSGKAMSVTITKLNEQYKKRFVRISRIFPQNE